MSRNEDVTTGIWVDLMGLGPEAKLLYLWSFTNEHNGMSGLYKIHTAMIQVETGLTEEGVSSALSELAESDLAFFADGVILVRSRVKKLRQRTPQIAKSIARDISRVRPDHPLRVRFMETYGDEKWLSDAFKEVGIVSLTRGSVEPQENTRAVKDFSTLNGPSTEGPRSRRGSRNRNGLEKIDLPDDFPRELKPHLRAVFKVLRALAERHHAKAVSPLSLAAVVMGRPHKPLVAAAYDFAGWAEGQAAHRKDVVSGYRNWLERTNDLAGFEQLGPDGLPAGGSRRGNENASSMLRDMWPDVVDAQVVEETAR